MTDLRMLVFTLFAVSVLITQSVSKVAFSEANGEVPAFSDSGIVKLPMQTVQLEIRKANGSVERGNLVVVYDPKNGFFFWHVNAIQDQADTRNIVSSLQAGRDALFLSDGGLFEFAMPGPTLGVLPRSQKAPSIDAAEAAAVGEIRAGFAEGGKGYDPGYVMVELGQAIGRQWACPDGDSPAFDPLCGFRIKRFVSVSLESSKWKIVAGNRWEQEIVLDSKFGLVSTNRL